MRSSDRAADEQKESACMKTAASAMILAASLAASATAHAGCGDPGQNPCTGPVPTVDQVLDLLGGMTDPDIPAANKTNIVTPGFSPDEAGTIDNHLTRMKVFGGILPLPFHVTDIQPAPNNFAGATVEVNGWYRQSTNPHPIVLASQGGRWLITHDTAIAEMDVIWRAAERSMPGFVK
jgi:hypothetical protein